LILSTNKYEKIIDALIKFPKKSNKEIAARVGVSASYVYKVKSARDDTSSNGLSWELPDKTLSDGSTASYYELPSNAEELQDLISYRDMNAQIGEVFRSCYRYGIASHSDKLRDAKKIKFYIDAEIKRLENRGK
jgi:hypothetical protein